MQADSFVQPLPKFAGTYPRDWAGYIHLQPRTPEGRSDLLHIGDDYNGAGGGDADLGLDVVGIGAGICETVIPWNGNYGFGNHVFIRHELTNALREKVKRDFGIDSQIFYSHYAHLKDYIIKPGQEIAKGQVIAHVGKTGTKQAHLHFDVRKPTGAGYESYPSAVTQKSWVEQYYPRPFTFVEKYKEVTTDAALAPKLITAIPSSVLLTILNGPGSDGDKLLKIKQLC